MARASQLPSGQWRVRVTDPESGKRISITAATEREANYQALEFELGKDRKARIGKTVGEAVDDYITIKDGVLSPTTIQGYRAIRKNNLKNLMDYPVKNLTQKIVQEEFNREAKTPSKRTGKLPSPKSLANMHGLLSAALQMECPDFQLHTTLPARQKRILELPDAEQVINAVIGSDVELPVLLAAWLSLSMSEIRGLQAKSIRNGFLYVEESLVDINGSPTLKQSTKAYERTRKHKLPTYIMQLIESTDAWKDGSGFLITMSHDAIVGHFRKLLAEHGVQDMTFHQLRHLNASVMLALGVPDLYAMERGGWSTNTTLKGVYQHTFSKERQLVDQRIDAYFYGILPSVDTSMDTNDS